MSTAQDYQAAEQLLRRPARPGELVIGDKVRPQWIDGGARFWYAVSNGVGRRFVLVDPAAGTREPAFDHARLAAALAATSGQQVDPEALPFMAIELAGNAVEFDALAVLRQLAQTRPRMDLDRVGAFGHSGGGFATARAMLDFPEVYKAGVALSGPHDARYFNLSFLEAYDGADNPEAWARASNVDLADRLAGKQLLIVPGPCTRTSTAWPTSPSAAGTSWCAS